MSELAEQRPECVYCGYALTGISLSGVCPECGKSAAPFIKPVLLKTTLGRVMVLLTVASGVGVCYIYSSLWRTGSSRGIARAIAETEEQSVAVWAAVLALIAIVIGVAWHFAVPYKRRPPSDWVALVALIWLLLDMAVPSLGR